MKIIDGNKIAQEIKDDLKKKVAKLAQKPGLAVVLIGTNKASELYIKLKEKAAKEIGVVFCKYIFASDSKKKEVYDTIEWLNQDNQINGILLQLPLPRGWDSDEMINKINPKKDVDGLKNNKFTPPFILAIIEALESTQVDLNPPSASHRSGKKIMALVNSDIFGKKLKSVFKKKGWTISYFKKPTQEIKKADVLISACGQPEIIKEDMIKKDCILIDGGITKKKHETVGDIDGLSVVKKAGFLAPVPGGVGPITVAMLLRNTLSASKK